MACLGAVLLAFSSNLGFFEPPVLMSATDQVKIDAPLVSAVSREINFANLNCEIVRANITWSGGALQSTDTIYAKWYNVDTGVQIFVCTVSWNVGWTGAWAKFWIGHLLTGEIDRAGNYKVVISDSLGVFYPKTINFVITEAVAPGPGILTVDVPDVSPASSTMPVDLDVVSWIRYNGSTSLVVDLDCFLINSAGVSSMIMAKSNVELYAKSADMESFDKTFYALPVGVYDVTVRVLTAGVFNILATNTAVGAFTVTAVVPPPEVPLWKRILTLMEYSLTQFGLWIAENFYTAINFVFRAVTGRDMTESDAGVVGDNLPGVQGVYVLLSGKDLQGNARTYLSDSEAIGVIVFAVAAGVTAALAVDLGVAIATVMTSDQVEAAIEHFINLKGGSYVPTSGSVVDILMKVFGAKTPLVLMSKVLMGVIGIDGIATWLASDNIVSGTAFPMNRLKQMVEDGTLSKADALVEIDRIQAWKDYATNFISVSGIANPFLWLFRSLFMKNTELAQLNINEIRAQVESAVPVIPPELMGTVILSSIPTGAKIYVDDVYVWESTNTTFKVSPGHRKITLKKDDYTDSSREIDILAGETLTIAMTLTSVLPPPVTPPVPPPTIPSEEVVIPLVPTTITYNAWKVTIKAVDASTNAELAAWILINDVFMTNSTPFYYYFAPSSNYNIKLRLKGYKQAELVYTTKPLPEA